MYVVHGSLLSMVNITCFNKYLYVCMYECVCVCVFLLQSVKFEFLMRQPMCLFESLHHHHGLNRLGVEMYLVGLNYPNRIS